MVDLPFFFLALNSVLFDLFKGDSLPFIIILSANLGGFNLLLVDVRLVYMYMMVLCCLSFPDKAPKGANCEAGLIQLISDYFRASDLEI